MSLDITNLMLTTEEQQRAYWEAENYHNGALDIVAHAAAAKFAWGLVDYAFDNNARPFAARVVEALEHAGIQRPAP